MDKEIKEKTQSLTRADFFDVVAPEHESATTYLEKDLRIIAITINVLVWGVI